MANYYRIAIVNKMEKCQLKDELLQKVKSYIKSGYNYNTSLTRTRRWYDKWKPNLQKGRMWYKNKPLIPESEVQSYLTTAVQKGMPLSRDGAYQWLKERAWGFKKNVVYKYISSLEAFQLMKKHPFKNSRQNITQSREGSSQLFLGKRFHGKKFGGKTTVGIDLTFIPRQTDNFPREAWTKYKYLYVAVVQSNNYTFAYGMVRKNAVEARRCVRRLVADFKARYNLSIDAIVRDAGGEFLGEHSKYLTQQNIQQYTVSKVWWVERRNSMLMREIALLREGFGYGWEHAFKNALLKINGTYSRKIKRTPDSVTGDELQKGLIHFNRKLKKKPKTRKQPTFKIKDRVRHLLKSAMDVNTVLWKSYNAFRDRKTHVWSKNIYSVRDKKRKGRTTQYLVNDKWFFPWQLQLVIGEVVVLKAPKPIRKQAPMKPKKKVAQAEISSANLRRGTRVRKKTVFYGR